MLKFPCYYLLSFYFLLCLILCRSPYPCGTVGTRRELPTIQVYTLHGTNEGTTSLLLLDCLMLYSSISSFSVAQQFPRHDRVLGKCCSFPYSFCLLYSDTNVILSVSRNFFHSSTQNFWWYCLIWCLVPEFFLFYPLHSFLWCPSFVFGLFVQQNPFLFAALQHSYHHHHHHHLVGSYLWIIHRWISYFQDSISVWTWWTQCIHLR